MRIRFNLNEGGEMDLKKMFTLVIVMGLMFMSVPKTFAGEIDILVDKLVEKGILTRSEANEVLSETKEEVKRQAASVDTSGVPKWVQKTKIMSSSRQKLHLTISIVSGFQNKKNGKQQ